MSDPVNNPDHYRWLPGDLEVIDITEGMSFCHGNVVKYVLRADHKGRPIEDLRKAAWYLDREIARREAADAASEAFWAIEGPLLAAADVLGPFTTPGYVASDEQFVRGEE